MSEQSGVAVSTEPKQGYVLMHQRGHTWLATGTLHLTRELNDLPVVGDLPLVSVVPYSQLRERGLVVHDDGEEILTLVPESVTVLDPEQLRLPDDAPRLTLSDLDLTVSDDEYAATVEMVIRDEICRGEGANFLISRQARARAENISDAAVRDMFARVVVADPLAYMTFCFFAGDRYFVGASPERHITVQDGEVTMSPVCGTLPKAALRRRADLIEFITDPKEINELFQVVDEELKMMSRICSSGGTVVGPYLQETSSVIHTAYDLTGRSTMRPIDILRDSMFAATMIGSPLENAARVIAKYEPGSRRYYTGAVVVRTPDGGGGENLDSAITIRTVEIDTDGTVVLQSGSTIVRDSDPASEVAEVVSKMQGPLNALRGVPAAPPVLESYLDRTVLDILELRNRYLSRFWMRDQQYGQPPQEDVTPSRPLRILVIDHEDEFTHMLVHALRSMGHLPTWHRWSEDGWSLRGWDLVLLGPGPGDPLQTDKPKMAQLHSVVATLLKERIPFLAVCLAHQALAHQLGLAIVAVDPPRQGVQETVDLFGRREAVGFYNTFCPVVADGDAPADVQIATFDDGRHVAAIRGSWFSSFQFHVESVLTSNTIPILREAIERLPTPG